MLIEELMTQARDGSILAEARPLCEDSVFLNRIKELERLHNMHSFVFMERYDERNLDLSGDVARLEFAEWYMLCERFSEQIEEGIVVMTSPPLIQDYVSPYEGPSNRAFSFGTLNVCRCGSA